MKQNRMKQKKMSWNRKRANRRKKSTLSWVAVAISTSLLAAACGGGSESAESGDSAADVATTESKTTTTEAETTTTEAAGDFPLTIEHKFGEAVIEAEPERIVSIGYNEHDFLLSLGVVPVGLRDWYGDQPNSVWPWAQDALGGATPDVLSGDLNYEQIAALRPDVIVGIWSGMTDEEYELLSAIAPTVAQPAEYEDYGTPWQEQTLILGKVTGRLDLAEEIVEGIESRVVEAREAHPEWAGQSAAVGFMYEGNPGAYFDEDPRSRFLVDLGFEIPPEYMEASGDTFFFETSPENLEPLDVDLLVWLTSSDEEAKNIVDNLPTRATMRAFKEGRELFAGEMLTGAFSHSSPLSLGFVLDQLVPEIELAVDGDPFTVVPSALELGSVVEGAAEAAASGGDVSADSEAAGAAWAIVFDSTATFADKASHLEDADALKETLEAYATGGESFGGISLAPTEVVIDGSAAAVTYDVNFGENSAYTDLNGEIALVDGEWVVSRDTFCAFMSEARTPCP